MGMALEVYILLSVALFVPLLLRCDLPLHVFCCRTEDAHAWYVPAGIASACEVRVRDSPQTQNPAFLRSKADPGHPPLPPV